MQLLYLMRKIKKMRKCVLKNQLFLYIKIIFIIEKFHEKYLFKKGKPKNLK